MFFDKKSIFEYTGLNFETDHDVILYLVRHLEFLSAHNKNYTKEQEKRLYDVESIIYCLEEGDF
jgi:hypothetical protein